MKMLRFLMVMVSAAGLLLLSWPAMAGADTGETGPGPPPVGQQLVREGDLAVKLLFALGAGSTDDETEAESQLGELGIAPHNGWIADYPVTPDIIGELHEAVAEAVDAGKLSLAKDEALKRLDDVSRELGLAVRPAAPGKAAEAPPPAGEAYPSPTVVNNYYYNQGPPVVTYYTPPPDYYYLYSWVPYPFWWAGFWFPGFFVLNDFHRTVIINKRVVFVSNHFNDVRVHRVFRIDPVQRFRGRTFAGIGVSRPREFISTGVPKSPRTIFNGPRTRMVPGGRVITQPSRSGTRGGTMVTPPSRSGTMVTPPSRGVRGVTPSVRGERVIRQPSGSRMIAPPAGGQRMGIPPARGGGGFERRERR